MVHIKDHEGLWYQQQDMLSKFLRRPENPIQSGKMFTTSGVKGNKRLQILDENEKDNPELDIEGKAEEIDEIENSNQSPNKKKFHFIMTELDDTVPIPKMIEIRDPYPGEPKWMRKRKGPAVIRYQLVLAL